MSININQTNKQVSQLAEYSYKLKTVKNDLLLFDNLLRNNWKSTEVKYINIALNEIIIQVNRVSVLLDSCQTDIVYAVQKIQQIESELQNKVTITKDNKVSSVKTTIKILEAQIDNTNVKQNKIKNILKKL